MTGRKGVLPKNFEQIQKLAWEINRGKKLSEKQKLNISMGMKASEKVGHHLGVKMSEETKKKISLALKKYTENPEVRKRMSNREKGKMPKNFHEAQKKSWEVCKGRKLSKEHRLHISMGLMANEKRGRSKGFYTSEETKIKMSLAKKGKLPQNHWQAGEKHWNWKGGVTPQDRLERERFRKTMQKLVFERDNYECQMCGERGNDLQVDHIQPWADYVEGRFDINNCRTLCAKCHYKITFGKEMPETIKGWGHNLLNSKKYVTN
jgi:hypothetical protein